MELRYILVFLTLFMMSLGKADDACTPGTEFEPPLCPLNLPSIASISIQTNGASTTSDSAAAVECRQFLVTEQQVLEYFKRAQLTNANDVHHTLDWSPCFASGQVVFLGDKKGHWRLQKFRTAALSMEGAEELVLYCPKCQFSPFE